MIFITLNTSISERASRWKVLKQDYVTERAMSRDLLRDATPPHQAIVSGSPFVRALRANSRMDIYILLDPLSLLPGPSETP